MDGSDKRACDIKRHPRKGPKNCPRISEDFGCLLPTVPQNCGTIRSNESCCGPAAILETRFLEPPRRPKPPEREK